MVLGFWSTERFDFVPGENKNKVQKMKIAVGGNRQPLAAFQQEFLHTLKCIELLTLL